MGQYYRPILGNVFGTGCKVFDRSVDGERTFAKLMEHSWWFAPFVNSFSARLYNEVGRVAWVGDYADESDDFHFPHCSAFYVPSYSEVWSDSVQTLGSTSTDFTLDGKFLLNHDTAQYVNLDEYKAASQDAEGWCIHPLPLLTAVGNDRGSGDFHEGNVGYEYVGIWAWHLLSIVDTCPKYFSKFKLAFKEII